jgi:hypothetical protein
VFEIKINTFWDRILPSSGPIGTAVIDFHACRILQVVSKYEYG